MVRSRLLLVLALITVTAGGTLSGASAGASELDGQGLHCESTAFRHGLYTEGCAAVGTYPADNSYLFGQTEASAYQLVDGQRVPAKKVLVRIATSQIYVNGQLADTRACSCAPAAYVSDATRFVQAGQLPSGNTAQAAVTYEVWAVRGHRPVAVVATHTVMGEVVATPTPLDSAS
jgi:hypothetical protein